MALVERGVYTRPYLTAEGREVLVAVDYQSREVGSLTLEPGDNPYTALVELWDLLDLADPDHARRRRADPRRLDAAKKAGALLLAFLPAASLVLG